MDAVTPPHVDPSYIRSQAGLPTFERGAAYFEAGAVSGVAWDAASEVLASE